MKKQRKKRRFRHINRHDRNEIQILLEKGYTQKDIASVLKVDKSTISREIGGRKRKNGRYDADTANQKARVKRLHSKYQGMKMEDIPLIRDGIIEELNAYRSPDEITGRINKEAGYTVIGKDAVYHWLYSAWGNKYAHLLCTKRRKPKKQKGKEKREMIPERISISMRPPKGVHAEGDIFVSPRRAETPASIAMVVENESKYLWGQKIPNRKADTMREAMKKMKKELSIDDLTLDNGVENKKHTTFGISTYFCDPQSPWQKPHIEESIGLIRRWFIPKGTDLLMVSEEELRDYIAILNNKWRKILGYASAYEVALNRGILKTKISATRQKQKVTKRVAFEVRI